MVRYLFILLLLRGTTGKIVQKQPAFATSMLTDSYLPAAMQVIFHTVEQLKVRQAEETLQMAATASSTSPASANQRDPKTTTSIVELTEATVASSPQDQQEAEPTKATIGTTVESYQSTSMTEDDRNDGEDSPEGHRETPEVNYATSEANEETPSDEGPAQEANGEISEVDQKREPAISTLSTAMLDSSTNGGSQEPETPAASTIDSTTKSYLETQPRNVKQQRPTIDFIVGEIYEIVKSTSTELYVESIDDKESKSALEVTVIKAEFAEEEAEENRFTLLGEKVAQVPRPSLTGYLRRAKVPPRVSLQQLAMLYDSLSKDARKQGFGKYAGYSDGVLRTLMESAEGGAAQQLKIVLEKVLERNELTREDARMRAGTALESLKDPSSSLSKDLRHLLPLRYAP